MTTSPADALLHPIRLRIVLAAAGREVTAADLGRELPDVPTATLYRHLATLTDADLLKVVHERPVRGAVERTYRVNTSATHLGADDVAHLTPEDHHAAFTAFVGALLDSFGRYVHSPGAAPATDGVGYRQVRLLLTDDELEALVASLQAAVAPHLDNEAGPGRTPRLLSTILLPDPLPRPYVLDRLAPPEDAPESS